MNRFRTSFIAPAALALMMTAGAVALAEAEDEQPNPPQQHWSFYGIFGKYNQAQLQRGFQVYREVCSRCHRLSIPFRELADPGLHLLSVAPQRNLTLLVGGGFQRFQVSVQRRLDVHDQVARFGHMHHEVGTQRAFIQREIDRKSVV